MRVAVVDVRGMPAWMQSKARRHLRLFCDTTAARFAVPLEDVVRPRECLVARTQQLHNDGYVCEEIGPGDEVRAALAQDTQYIGSDADSCERLLRRMQRE